jgi:AhpD family alkylhydroperoxidase
MERRLDYAKAAPQGLKALLNLQAYVNNCDLEHSLLELVKTRASQINGCAYCLDMHTKDARAGGESEHRLYLLSAWREAPFYSARERAALAWTEAVTRIADGGIEDDLYGEVRRHFDEKQITDLTFAVIAINSWNRLAIPFRTPPGSYQPSQSPSQPLSGHRNTSNSKP